MYILLVMSLLLIILVAWWLSGWDYLHPAVINAEVYFLAALGCLVALGSWIFEDLDVRAYFMVVGGTFLFTIGAVITFRRSRHGFPRLRMDKIVAWYDAVDPIVLVVVDVALFVCCLATRAEIISIGVEGLGIEGESLNSIQDQVKWAASKDFLIEGHLWATKIVIPIVQSFSVLVPLMLALEFSPSRKICDKKKRVCLLIAAILIMANALISGERIPILLFATAFLLSSLILFRRFGGKDFIAVKMILKWIFPSFLGMVFFCYIVLPLTGRSTEVGFIDYISFYISSGIPALSEFFSTGISFEPEFPCAATFKNLISFIGIHFGDVVQINDGTGNLWIDFGEELSTNIFTRYFRYYLDFGWIGFCGLTILCGAFYGFLYRVINTTDSVWLWGVSLFFLSYLGDAERQEGFCTLMAPFLIKFAIFLWIIVCIMPRIKKCNETHN